MVILEQLIVTHLNKKSPALVECDKTITVFKHIIIG